jgi:hypothetical protein
MTANDPIPRFVLKLCDTLQFETRSGETFVINPSDILLAQAATSGPDDRSLPDSDGSLVRGRKQVPMRPGHPGPESRCDIR